MPRTTTPRRRSGLRLTTRGRIVVATLALIVFLPALGSGALAIAHSTGTQELTVHTVAPGDTLWGIAATLVEPGQDVRPMVSRIRDLNGLPSASIEVGQSIVLPSM